MTLGRTKVLTFSAILIGGYALNVALAKQKEMVKQERLNKLVAVAGDHRAAKNLYHKSYQVNVFEHANKAFTTQLRRYYLNDITINALYALFPGIENEKIRAKIAEVAAAQQLYFSEHNIDPAVLIDGGQLLTSDYLDSLGKIGIKLAGEHYVLIRTCIDQVDAFNNLDSMEMAIKDAHDNALASGATSQEILLAIGALNDPELEKQLVLWQQQRSATKLKPTKV